MHRPEVLILDEPTGGLDPLDQNEFRALTRETAADGRTVFLSSHSLDEVQHIADRVGIIRERRLIDVDSVGSLRERSLRHITITFAERVDPGRSPRSTACASRAPRTPSSGCRRPSPRWTGSSRPPRGTGSSTSSRSRPTSRRSSSSSTGRTMEAVELLNRGLRDRTRALIGWCVGVAAYIALIAAIFPSIEGSANLDELVQNYPEALKSLFGFSGNLTSGPGFIDTELFNLMLPLLAIVLAISSGTRTLAGEEEAGRLELPFAYPVRRRDGVVAKGLAVGLEVAIFAPSCSSRSRCGPGVRARPSSRSPGGGVIGLGLLAVLHGWLSLAVGAAHPSRALAIAVPAAFAAFSFLVNGLHELASWLDPFRFLSSFWWIGQSPLSEGVRPVGLLVVGLASVLLLAAAALLIERRDLQVP